MGLGLVVLRSCQVIWAQAHDVGRVDWGLGWISDTVKVKVMVMMMASNAMSDHHQWPLAIGHRPSDIRFSGHHQSGIQLPSGSGQFTIIHESRILECIAQLTGNHGQIQWAHG